MNKTLRNLALVALAAAPFSAFAEIVGEGTADNPYQIATAEDLCNAHSKVNAGVVNYFVQTADIDMAGVEDYIPVNVDDVSWTRAFNYDGKNHVIKNFGPKWHADAGGDNGAYYVTSIFGVLNGVVKNLGVVDAVLNTSGVSQRAGILCGYAGSSACSIVDEVVIENVYVTGKVMGGTRNTAGLGGINQLPVTIKNCFVNLDMTCEGGTANAMLIGELKADVTVETSYLAGKVSGPCNFAYGLNGDTKGKVSSLVIFAEGEEAVLGCEDENDVVVMANTEATKEAGVDLVKSWAAFSATEEVDGLPALNYALSGAGTEENPYQIACAEDLCNAYRFVNTSGCDVWFKQTADIDMEGVTDYHAIAGYNGTYAAIIHYDGQNHLISNFAPDSKPWGPVEGTDWTGVDGTDYYYCTSIFGVASGTIYNLGVVDAYVATDHGAGILGGYAGHRSAKMAESEMPDNLGIGLEIDNVFVTGEVVGEAGYTGGLFGTTDAQIAAVNINNCFANVAVSGTTFTAGLIGRVQATTNLTGVYVAGTVAGTAPYLIYDVKGTPADCYFEDVIAFNTGAEAAYPESLEIPTWSDEPVVATEETKAELIAQVQGWDGFSDRIYNGYPMLAEFELGETTAIFDATVGEVEANGPAVYYNLQGVKVANPDNGIYIVRRGDKVTKELIRK